MSDRIKPSIGLVDNPTPAMQAALDAALAHKAAGHKVAPVSEAINTACVMIEATIASCLHAVSSGLCGEPTGEDEQRLHELRSLLEDLP